MHGTNKVISVYFLFVNKMVDIQKDMAKLSILDNQQIRAQQNGEMQRVEKHMEMTIGLTLHFPALLL